MLVGGVSTLLTSEPLLAGVDGMDVGDVRRGGEEDDTIELVGEEDELFIEKDVIDEVLDVEHHELLLLLLDSLQFPGRGVESC